MKGAFYIDDIDIYARYGVVIVDGSYGDLLYFPALKEPDANDWPEEDGIEADLAAPVLEAKEVTLSFVSTRPDIGDFTVMLSAPGYHSLRITELGKEWRLRLLTQPSGILYAAATAFSLRFADDFPDRPNTSPAPGSADVPVSDFELDGVSFSDYGIAVVSGWDDLLKSPTVKENLTRSFATSDGQVYDADHVVFNAKETTFKCCFIADSMTAFWQYYDAFFGAFIQPDERQLYWDYAGEEYPCYYKKCGGFKVLSLDGQVVIEFNLTLMFTVFRIGETEYVLANELGQILVLDDDTEIEISL